VRPGYKLEKTFQNDCHQVTKAHKRAGMSGLLVNQEKYDYYYGGRAEWLTRVHGIALDQITPATIQEWKQSFLAKAGSDPPPS
jgi:hypothetical protein